MGVKLRHRKLSDGSKSYFLDIIHNGDRWKEPLNLYASRGNAQAVKEQAETIRSSRELELAASTYGVLNVRAKKKSFVDFYEQYAKNCQKGDGKTIRASYGKFMDFLKNPKKDEYINGRRTVVYTKKNELLFGQLNETVCENFKNYLLTCTSGKGVKLQGEAPINYFSKFKKVIKQAKKEKLIKDDPAEFISISSRECTPSLLKEVLTIDEILKLSKTPCPNSNVYKAFLFCCISGLRTSEARVFNPKDITYTKVDDIIIPHIDIDQTKGSNPKPKLIPLNPFAFELLGNFDIESKEPFFKLPSQNGVNKILRSWVQAAGIEKHITFYCSRHSCGTNLVASGTDLRTAAAILGHSSLKYIMRYAHEVDTNKVSAVNKLNISIK